MSKSSLTIDGADLARVSLDGVAIIDAGEIAQANQALADIHGADSVGEIVGRAWTDLYRFDEPGRTVADLPGMVHQAGEWRGRAIASRPDGPGTPVEVSVCATDDCLVSVVSERSDPGPSGRPDRTSGETSGNLVVESTEQPGLSWDILDALDDVIYIVDEDDAVVDWNQRLNERLGYSDEELEEMEIPEFLTPEDRDLLAEADRRLVDFPDRVREMEVVTKDGERIPHELRGVTFTEAATGERYRVGIARDIAERKRREERFERYETIVETVDDGVYVLDEDLHVDMANDRCYDMLAEFGFSREDVHGMHAHDLVVNEDERAELEATIEQAIETEPHIGSFEMSAQTPDGDTAVFESRFRLYPEPEGEHRGCIGILRDITDRKERERELREAREFNAELVENAPFSMVRIDDEFEITYVNPRTEEVTGLPERQESEALGVDIRELPSVAETGQADRFTPLKNGETIEFEFPFESLYGREVYFTGRGVPLMKDGAFDGAVLMAVDISERRQQEKDLERQRDELDTLNEINELLLAVARDLFEPATQNDIERTVCRRLADSELYQYAWIGKPDLDGTRIIPDADAGIDEVDVEPIAVEADERSGVEDLIGSAFRTGTVQVEQGSQTDLTAEHRRASATPGDVRSVAAVPLAYEGTTYGVLVVYASRPLAFSQREQHGFRMLGQATGYAIHASRTRELLFAEQVTEVEFRVDEANEFVLEASERLDCSLSLEGYLSTGDEHWLTYFSLPEADSERFVDVAREDPAVEAVRTVDDEAERVVAVTLKSSFLDEIATLGGRVTSGVIEAGAGTVVVEIPKSTAVSEFVEQIRTIYPGAELLAKRDGERPAERSGWLSGETPLDITDRQQQALEAAYFAGYFEWPRENAAEDVADLLNISRPTLQAHLRKAEETLVGRFIDSADRAGKPTDTE